MDLTASYKEKEELVTLNEYLNLLKKSFIDYFFNQ